MYIIFSTGTGVDSIDCLDDEVQLVYFNGLVCAVSVFNAISFSNAFIFKSHFALTFV